MPANNVVKEIRRATRRKFSYKSMAKTLQKNVLAQAGPGERAAPMLFFEGGTLFLKKRPPPKSYPAVHDVEGLIIHFLPAFVPFEVIWFDPLQGFGKSALFRVDAFGGLFPDLLIQAFDVNGQKAAIFHHDLSTDHHCIDVNALGSMDENFRDIEVW